MDEQPFKKPKLECDVDFDQPNLADPCDSTFEPKIQFVIPLLDLPPEPYQPENVPPYRDRRRPHLFQVKWYKEYPWLHFDPSSQMMFCHQCLLAISKNFVQPPTHNIFARGGFRNWKKGVERFRVHENSQLHKETYEFSVEKRRLLTQTYYGVQSAVNCIQYLISQGVFLKNNSLSQLLDLRKEDLPFVDDLLKKVHFTTDVEKEIVSIMAGCTLRTLCCRIRGYGDFGLIVDKVNTPIGEMLALNVRTVDQFSSIHFFLGLYVEQSIYKDLPKFFDFTNLKYHSYNYICDKNNLRDKIQKLQPDSLCVPSWNMNLSMVLQKKFKEMIGIGNCINLVQELKNVMSNSDFGYIFDESTDETVPLSTKKDYLSFKTISGILNNYSAILDTLEELGETSPCSFLPSALKDRMSTSEMFFYFLICKVLIYPVENLSNIADKAKSAQGVKEAADSVLKILHSYKEDKEFDILWTKFQTSSQSIGLTQEDSNESQRKDKYKSVYFKSVDLFLKHIDQLYNNDHFDSLLDLERALFSNNEDKFDEKTETVLKSFEITVDTFIMEKSMLRNTLDADLSSMNLEELASKLKTLKAETINLFPLINRLMYLLTLAPITRISDERAFSRARAFSSFISEYKSTEMVSDFCVCYVYKEEPGILNTSEVAQEYIESDPIIKSVILKS